MLYVLEDGTIRLTRGDTARLSVNIVNDADGSTYEVRPNDVLIMSLKKNIRDATPVMQKKIVGVDTFHIEPDDTHDLEFGKYLHDVQITTEDSDVYTVIGPCAFEVMKEVTY